MLKMTSGTHLHRTIKIRCPLYFLPSLGLWLMGSIQFLQPPPPPVRQTARMASFLQPHAVTQQRQVSRRLPFASYRPIGRAGHVRATPPGAPPEPVPPRRVHAPPSPSPCRLTCRSTTPGCMAHAPLTPAAYTTPRAVGLLEVAGYRRCILL
jgi:hypothetical protein